MPTVDFEARVETTMESIQSNDDIHPDNKERIREFKRDLKLADMSDAWLQKLTAHLKVIAEHVGDTRFEQFTAHPRNPHAKHAFSTELIIKA